MIVADRIDLKVAGTWAKNYRPNGLTLLFGSDPDGGDTYGKVSNAYLPVGTTVGGTAISRLTPGVTGWGGTATADAYYYVSTVYDVVIPYGVTFAVETTIDGVYYPVGKFLPTGDDTFDMGLIQLIDNLGRAVFSVRDVSSNELIGFNRPLADISRLVMYRYDQAIDADTFACYSIVFRTNLTLNDIKAFALLHPSDVNPVIIDDGSVQNPSYLIPQ